MSKNVIECPKCGHKNDPDNKFCGGCGAPLKPPKKAAASTPTDPLEKHMSQVKGGRDAKWAIRMMYKGKLNGWDVWNYWDMNYSVPADDFAKPMQKIRDHKHYELNKSFEYIIDPPGKKTIGGYFYIITKFKKNAPEPLKNKTFQMLFLARDRTQEMRLIAAKEKDLTPEIIDQIMQQATNHPENMEYVSYFTLKNYPPSKA